MEPPPFEASRKPTCDGEKPIHLIDNITSVVELISTNSICSHQRKLIKFRALRLSIASTIIRYIQIECVKSIVVDSTSFRVEFWISLVSNGDKWTVTTLTHILNMLCCYMPMYEPWNFSSFETIFQGMLWEKIFSLNTQN